MVNMDFTWRSCILLFLQVSLFTSTCLCSNDPEAKNYCRNPDGSTDGPWRYTTEPGTKTKKSTKVQCRYCDVPRCPLWVEGCKTTILGKKYRGMISTTREGLQCQRWDSQSPHKHDRNNTADFFFPDASLEEANNYCRNPDDSPEGPWCYTKDPDTRWQYCPVTRCKCGVTDVMPKSDRIVGGFEAAKHSFPWQVQVGYSCGGSIISEHWVITAAHCVKRYPLELLRVVAGAHNRYGDEVDRQVRKVSQIIIHEEYVRRTLVNDIALLRLSSDLEFNTAVKPVCLPHSGVDVPDDKLCITTGWGHTSYQGSMADALMQVYVPIVSHDTCRVRYYGQRIKPTMVCAGFDEGGKDSCQGDSGGPLVCKQSGAFVLQGVTSWGRDCGKRFSPGVYTRTSKFISWIEEKTGGEFQTVGEEYDHT